MSGEGFPNKAKTVPAPADEAKFQNMTAGSSPQGKNKQSTDTPQENPFSKSQQVEEKKPTVSRREKFKESLKSVRKFMWNPETKEFMGRGAFRWGLLCTYYLMFYVTLFALATALFSVFLAQLPSDKPTLLWTKDRNFRSSLIQQYPSVVITPGPNTSVNSESPLIWVDTANGLVWGKTTSNYVDGVKAYAAKHPACSKCPILNLGQCLGAPTFGFKNAAPVFVFSLSKILGYMPTLFSSEAEVEEFFKQFKSPHIKRVAKALGVYSNLDRIYILCHGETMLDQEIIGIIHYCTNNYVLPSDFPYEDPEKGYLSPTIAITFPDAIPGIPFAIECYPVLKGLKIDKSRGVGYNRMEVMLT